MIRNSLFSFQNNIKDCGWASVLNVINNLQNLQISLLELKNHYKDKYLDKEELSIYDIEQILIDFNIKSNSIEVENKLFFFIRIKRYSIITIAKNGLNHYLVFIKKTKRSVTCFDSLSNKLVKFSTYKFLDIFSNYIIVPERIKKIDKYDFSKIFFKYIKYSKFIYSIFLQAIILLINFLLIYFGSDLINNITSTDIVIENMFFILIVTIMQIFIVFLFNKTKLSLENLILSSILKNFSQNLDKINNQQLILRTTALIKTQYSFYFSIFSLFFFIFLTFLINPKIIFLFCFGAIFILGFEFIKLKVQYNTSTKFYEQSIQFYIHNNQKIEKIINFFYLNNRLHIKRNKLFQFISIVEIVFIFMFSISLLILEKETFVFNASIIFSLLFIFGKSISIKFNLNNILREFYFIFYNKSDVKLQNTK